MKKLLIVSLLILLGSCVAKEVAQVPNPDVETQTVLNKNIFATDYSTVAQRIYDDRLNSAYLYLAGTAYEYAEKSGFDQVGILKSSAFEIEYWLRLNEVKVAAVVLRGKTPLFSLSDYIGVSEDDVLATFGTPTRSGEPYYENLDSWFHFVIENKKVKTVELGASL